MATLTPTQEAIGDWRDVSVHAWGSRIVEVGLFAGGELKYRLNGDDPEALTDFPFRGDKDNIDVCVIGDILHMVWSQYGDVRYARWNLDTKTVDLQPTTIFVGTMPRVACFEVTRLIVVYVSSTSTQESRNSLDGGSNWSTPSVIDPDISVENVSLSISQLDTNQYSWANLKLGGDIFESPTNQFNEQFIADNIDWDEIVVPVVDFNTPTNQFNEQFVADGVDWEPIIVPVVDFSTPTNQFLEDFDDDWGFGGGGYLSANGQAGNPSVWYNIQFTALGDVTALPNVANTLLNGDATGDLAVPGLSNAPECILSPIGTMHPTSARRYLRFDKSNTEALQGSLTSSYATGSFFAAVVRWNTPIGGTDEFVFDGDDVTNRMALSRGTTNQDWELYSGAAQPSGAAVEVGKWVRIVGRLGANGILNIERARHIGGDSGANTLDGITLGCRYDETLHGDFDLAEFALWELDGAQTYGYSGATLSIIQAWLEYNFPFAEVPPGNPDHHYDPTSEAPAANVSPVDRGSGGENLIGTAFEVGFDADCPEQPVFKLNGSTSRAVDDGVFSLTGDVHLFATMIRPAAGGLGSAQHVMASNGGAAWSVGLNVNNEVVRDFGIAQAGDDIDTLAPFANAQRWVSLQTLTAAGGGNGATYVDGIASGVANEGDNDPVDFSIGAQAGAGHFEGSTADILVYSGADEANPARAAQVQDWITRHRLLATLPSTNPPFWFDAKQIAGSSDPALDPLPNLGSEDNFDHVGGGLGFDFVTQGRGPKEPFWDTTPNRIEMDGNYRGESATAFVAIPQPAAFAVISKLGTSAGFDPLTPGTQITMLGSNAPGTEWIVEVVGVGGALNSEGEPRINAGVDLQATGGRNWKVWEKDVVWVAGEFNGATSHIEDSLGNSAAGDAGSESLGTLLEIFTDSTLAKDWFGHMFLAVIAPGVSHEQMTAWLRMRYPNIEKQ